MGAARALACLLLVVTGIAGCRSLPPLPDAGMRTRFGQMRVVVEGPEQVPVGTGRPEATPPSGGADPGRDALVAGAVAAGSVATIAPYQPFGAAVMVAGFIIAGTAALGESIPRRIAKQLDARLADAVATPPIDARFAAALERAAALHPQARPHGLVRDLPGADTQLELRIDAAGLQGAGDEPALKLYLSARSRVRDSAGAVLHQRDYMHLSPPQAWSAWLVDDGAPIRAALDAGLEALAARVLEELFVTTRFPFDATTIVLPGETGFGSCWLAPLDPPLVIDWPIRLFPPLTHAGYERMGRRMLRYTPVASLTPTLRWEPLPRPRDRVPRNAALIARIADVVYDVKVWEVQDGSPTRLIYERRGLPAPEHTLESALAPEQDYFWSFRARFTLDGEPQTSRWAFSLVPAPPTPPDRSGGYCERDAILDLNYHRFTTRKPAAR